MSKRKGKSRSTKYTPMTHYGTYIPTIGDGGDECVGVNVRKLVSVDIDGMNHPLEMNSWEARKFARGLLKAADLLDGGQLKETR